MIGTVDGEERRPTTFEQRFTQARTAIYAALLAECTEREVDRSNRRADLALNAAHAAAETLRPTFIGMRDRIAIMQSSKFWKLRNAWCELKARIGRGPGPMLDLRLPSDVEVGRINAPPYWEWRRLHDVRGADLDRMRSMVELLALRPLISVVMPVYNTRHEFLRDAIDSVRRQAYPHWELCIADDASTDAVVRDILREFSYLDARIKIIERPENGHISRASNSALSIASGDFIALLDHDDELAPNALFDVAVEINRRPDVDILYSDEDKIDEHGLRSSPFFKPDWSPDTMLSKMYSCHLSVYRRSLVEDVGGFRPEYDGSQDWDLMLRVSERSERITHIPHVLYSWRMHDKSAAGGTGVKPYAYDAAQRALSDALQRRKLRATVSPVPNYPPGIFHVRYTIVGSPKVDIIIPTRDRVDLLRLCLESLFERTTYEHYCVTVIDNGSRLAETFALFREFERREPLRFRVERFDEPFHYSRINNYGVSKTDGELLLFLNNDTAVIEPEWLEAMVEQGQRPSIGAAGAMLLYEDGTVQHAGVILGIGGVAGHSHRHFPASATGHYDVLLTTTNYAAVTGACLLTKRTDFLAVGGFEERLAVSFNDIDLCLKLLELGRFNVYVPHARLYHFESRSRGYNTTPERVELAKREEAIFLSRWKTIVADDPFYNRHYTRVYEGFSYRIAD